MVRRLGLALAALGLIGAAPAPDGTMVMAAFTVARSNGLFQPDFAALASATRAGLALAAPVPPRCDKPLENEAQVRRMINCALDALSVEARPRAIAATIRTLIHRLDQRNDLVTPDDQALATTPPQAGIGLRLTQSGDAVSIAGTLATSPARSAGVRPGQRLLAIDGQSVAGLALGDIVARLRGAAGSTVTLALADAAPPLSLTRVAPGPALQAFASHLEGDVLWIEIGELAEETPGLVRAALAATPGAQGVVLDLRDNGGGLLDSAMAVAGLFLPPTAIVADILGRDPRDIVRYRGTAIAKSRATRLPLVVLINGGTASGAEIIAAALADNHRGQLIGSNSHGLGTIQSLIGIAPGHYLRLTTHQVRRANGLLLVGARVEPGCRPGPDEAALIALMARGAPCPPEHRALP